MKTIILLCLCVFAHQSICQEGFNKAYDRGLTEAIYSVSYDVDALIVVGIIRHDSQSKQKYLITHLDTLGNIIKWFEISAENHLGFTLGVQVVNDGFGNLIIPLNHISGSFHGLIKFNINHWEIEFTSEYSFGTDRVVAINAIRQTLDGGYLMTGWTQRFSYDIDAFVLKASADGTLEWLKYVGQNNLTEQGFTIVQTHENEYVIGGKKGKTAYFFALDTLGNMRWQRHIQDTLDVAVRSLYKQQNGDWIYRSAASRPTTWDSDVVYDVWAPLFMRRDSALNLITRKEILPFAFMQTAYTMIPSRDGGWIMAGITTRITDEGDKIAGGVDSFYTEYGRVVKLDHDGDIEWQILDTAFHSRNLALNHLSGVVESPTGSIYAAGYAEHRINNIRRTYGWLLKITADGCVDTLCTTTSLLDQIDRLSNPVRIYPNPAHEYLIFDLPDNSPPARAELYDITGRKMQTIPVSAGTHQMPLDHGRISPGLYAWRVVSYHGEWLGTGKVMVIRD